MGRYRNFIDTFKAEAGPLTYTAIDFTNKDGNEFINEGNLITNQNAIPVGDIEDVGIGVELLGTTDYIENQVNAETFTVAARTFFIAFVPIASSSGGLEYGYLLDIGEGRTNSGLDVLEIYIYSDGRIRVNLGGTQTTFPAGSIVAGEPNYVGVFEQSSYSYVTINNPTNGYSLNQITGYDRDRYDLWVRLGALRNSTSSLKVQLMYFCMGPEFISPNILNDAIEYQLSYGRQVLPTNLDIARAIWTVALGPNRETLAADYCIAGESTINPFIYADQGELVEFLAFDTDENATNLTTGPVVPSPTETLVFNPVSGSDGGGTGTGLVAHIAGTVAIDGTAAERQIIVISDDPNGRQVLGQGMSAPDGTFDINYNDWGGAVIALAIDNYGGDWSPETALATGTIIHPTTPNGYVYEVTTGGTTGSTEPTWSINSSVNDGSVTFNPRPFYRPIASGPLAGEVLDEGTPIEPDYSITHLRLKDIISQADAYVAINELVIFDKAGNPVDLSGATATATASHSSYPPSLAIDSDSQTSWFNEANIFPVTFEIALLEPTTVSAIQINYTGGDPSGIRAPESFDIEVIEEGESVWALTDSYSGLTETEYASSGQDGVFTVTTP